MAPKPTKDDRKAAVSSKVAARRHRKTRDEHEDEDADADAQGSDSDAISTVYSSVSEDSLPPIHAYGHTYHGSGRIVVPNDKHEARRLACQHELFALCLGGRLCDARLPIEVDSETATIDSADLASAAASLNLENDGDADDETASANAKRPKQQHQQPPLTKPKFHILDVGTGTGQWAVEMGLRFPDAEILGTDISSALLPNDVPPNVTFEVADATEPWTPRLYDFIHLRNLVGGGIRDWPALIREAYAHLKPGGQLEFADVRSLFYESDPEHLDLDAGERSQIGAACREYSSHFLRLAHEQGIDFDPSPGIGEVLTQLGAERVRERMDLVPVWGYGHDPIMRRKGELLGSMFDIGSLTSIL
jgi:SAM-dependent methyltransferase